MNTKDLLNNLISTSTPPFTVLGLQDQINQDPETDIKAKTLRILAKTWADLVQSLNITLLQQITTALKLRVNTRFDLDVETKIPVNPTLDQITQLCTKIHQVAQELQDQKEEIVHFISFFMSAKTYVTSFSSASEILLLGLDMDRRETKLIKDSLLNDAHAYKDYLTNLNREFNRIVEEILSPRTNLCMRLESSIRLLEKYRNPENRFNLQT